MKAQIECPESALTNFALSSAFNPLIWIGDNFVASRWQVAVGHETSASGILHKTCWNETYMSRYKAILGQKTPLHRTKNAILFNVTANKGDFVINNRSGGQFLQSKWFFCRLKTSKGHRRGTSDVIDLQDGKIISSNRAWMNFQTSITTKPKYK